MDILQIILTIAIKIAISQQYKVILKAKAFNVLSVTDMKIILVKFDSERQCGKLSIGEY